LTHPGCIKIIEHLLRIRPTCAECSGLLRPTQLPRPLLRTFTSGGLHTAHLLRLHKLVQHILRLLAAPRLPVITSLLLLWLLLLWLLLLWLLLLWLLLELLLRLRLRLKLLPTVITLRLPI
jgi:hypothetical protein